MIAAIAPERSSSQHEAIFALMLRQLREEVVPKADTFVAKYGTDYSLSEVLALEGYFPLFGMPVRNAVLIHHDPNNGPNARAFPIERGKIDRALDIAISEFSPDSELTKDKEVIRCVGVAWPERTNSRGQVWINSGPPHLPKVEMVCRNCQTVSFGESDSCEICGASGDRFLKFTSWSPPAFVADFRGIRTYDGHINKDPKPVLSFPVGLEQPNREVEASNYNVASYAGTLVRTNTNNYEGYTFQRINSPAFRGFYLADGLSTPVETPQWLDPSAITDRQPTVALTTERKTDILLVTAEEWPLDFDHTDLPTRHKVRAAWSSFAEILGKAIILREDIEPTEISVGPRRQPAEDPVTGARQDRWGVFIADNLDNGAGYSSNYSTREGFDALLGYASTRLGADFAAPSHSGRCFSSCYDCLRNYGNRFSHAELDWRLGLDVLAILTGKTPSVALTDEHWRSVVGARFGSRLREFGLKDIELVTVDGFTIAKVQSKGFAIVPLHPLANGLLRFEQLRDELGDKVGLKIIFCCPYELERQPVSEIQRIVGQMRAKRSN
jgi:DEAD/DEAH box helicase domain-containing protein